MNTQASEPAISVIIAAYNRSAVLRYAIASVLAQTFADFELIVVGDGCTDDSEAVVRAFADARVSWHNLPENCGSQFGPNNAGLARARGRYVAYLGQDDLWHGEHLETLAAAIEETQADLVFSLALDIGPPENPTRCMMGLCPGGAYEWGIWAPPSAWLHRRDLIERIGPWRDWQTILLPTDVEFLSRAFDEGARIEPVTALTVFKLTSVARTRSYLDNDGSEQAGWWRRIHEEPELRYRELLAAYLAAARQHPDMAYRLNFANRIGPGSLTDQYRARRGLPRAPRRDAAQTAPLYLDRAMLRHLNPTAEDIAPGRDQRVLHEHRELPSDGLFLGTNWHSLETDGGLRWRWLDRNAEIVVTRPSGDRRGIVVDVGPGPGLARAPASLQLRDAAGTLVAEAAVTQAGPVTLACAVPPGPGATFLLDTEDGGRAIRGDPRVLNFRVFALRWADAQGRVGEDDGKPVEAFAQTCDQVGLVIPDEQAPP